MPEAFMQVVTTYGTEVATTLPKKMQHPQGPCSLAPWYNMCILRGCSISDSLVTGLSPSGPGFDSRSGQFSWLRFFSQDFSSTVRQMPGKFRPHLSLGIIGHRNRPKSFHMGVNDLRRWLVLKPIYTQYSILVMVIGNHMVFRSPVFVPSFLTLQAVTVVLWEVNSVCNSHSRLQSCPAEEYVLLLNNFSHLNGIAL